MIPLIPAILSGMLVVLMIMTIQVLVALRGVSSHFTWPSEERFVLDFLQNLLYWLSEYDINRLHVGLSSLSRKIPSRLVIVASFRPVIIPFGGERSSPFLSLVAGLLPPFCTCQSYPSIDERW